MDYKNINTSCSPNVIKSIDDNYFEMDMTKKMTILSSKFDQVIESNKYVMGNLLLLADRIDKLENVVRSLSSAIDRTEKNVNISMDTFKKDVSDGINTLGTDIQDMIQKNNTFVHDVNTKTDTMAKDISDMWAIINNMSTKMSHLKESVDNKASKDLKLPQGNVSTETDLIRAVNKVIREKKPIPYSMTSFIQHSKEGLK